MIIFLKAWIYYLKKLFYIILFLLSIGRSWLDQVYSEFFYTNYFILISYNNLRSLFPYLTQNGLDLLNKFLTFDPKQRITAQEALEHSYFK